MYHFKSKPEHFVVREDLWRTPSGSGQFFLVYLWKRNHNTMDIILAICKEFGLDKQSVSVCGLKDKTSIASQRFAFDSDQRPAWSTQETITDFLWQFGTIKQTTFHTTPLFVGCHKSNSFIITLTKSKSYKNETDSDLRTHLAKRIEDIQKYGIPNAYGIQRFGKKMRNFEIAKNFLEQDQIPTDTYMSKFILKAYPNAYFNVYASYRHRQMVKWVLTDVLEWDILVNKYDAYHVQAWVYIDWIVHHVDMKRLFDLNTSKTSTINGQTLYDGTTSVYDPQQRFATWPMIWSWTLIPPLETESYSAEKYLYTDPIRTEAIQRNAHTYKLKWLRRPLFLKPTNIAYDITDEWDIVLSFSLPTWSYATIVLGYIMQDYKDFVTQYHLYVPEVR